MRSLFLLLTLWLLGTGAALAQSSHDVLRKIEAALAQGELNRATRLLSPLRQAPEAAVESAAVMRLQGLIYLAQGRPDLVEALLRERPLSREMPLPLLGLKAEAALAQERYNVLLDELYPGAHDDLYNVAILNFRGRAYLGSARYGDAELAFRDALAQAPGQPQATLGLGWAQLHRGSAGEATSLLTDLQEGVDGERPLLMALIRQSQAAAPPDLDHLRRDLDNSPNHYRAHALLGGLLLDGGHHRDAAELFKARRRLNPEDPLIATLLAIAQDATGQSGAAADSLGDAGALLRRIPPDALSDAPTSQLLNALVAFAEGDWRQTLTQLERYGRSHPESPATQALMGIAYLELGDPQRGITRLKAALQQVPDHAPLRILLGDTYRAKHQHFDASRQYERALTAAASSSARIRLAQSLLEQGNRPQAQITLRQALAIDPQDARAAYLLALSLLQEARYGQAMEVARELLSHAPADAPVSNLLAIALAAAGQGDQARDVLEAGLRRFPERAELAANLAKLERQQGDLAGAAARTLALLETRPESLPLIREMARIEIMGTAPDKAIARLEAALRQAPESPPLAELLIPLYLHRGDSESALRLARDVAGQNPRDWHAVRGLAESLQAHGRMDVARIKLKQLSILAGYDYDQLVETAHRQLGAGDPAGAIFTLYEAIKAAPEATEARRWLGELLLQRGRTPEARDQLDYLRLHHPKAEATTRLEARFQTDSGGPGWAGLPEYRGYRDRLRIEPLLTVDGQLTAFDAALAGGWDRLDPETSGTATSAEMPLLLRAGSLKPTERLRLAWQLLAGPLGQPRGETDAQAPAQISYYPLSLLLPVPSLGCDPAVELELLCTPRYDGNQSPYRTLVSQGRLRRGDRPVAIPLPATYWLFGLGLAALLLLRRRRQTSP